MVRKAFVSACCSLALGCGAGVQAQPIGYDLEVAPVGAGQGAAPPPKVPDDVVAQAAAPIRALSLPGREEIPTRDLIRALLRAEALCVGEQHAVAAHHYAQLWLLSQLLVPARSLGLEFGIGLEMFQRPFQTPLSAYQQGHLDESELRRRTEYTERWGYPFQFYRPLLEFAREQRIPLIALNARGELTRAVAREGLDQLEPKRAGELPRLDLHDREHRADFERRMQGHPGLEATALDKYYAAQVVWDETMAERAAEWLAQHAPMRRMLIVAGQAHCQDSAIPARLERRGARAVSSVLLATEPPDEQLAERFDYALVVGD